MTFVRHSFFFFFLISPFFFSNLVRLEIPKVEIYFLITSSFDGSLSIPYIVAFFRLVWAATVITVEWNKR